MTQVPAFFPENLTLLLKKVQVVFKSWDLRLCMVAITTGVKVKGLQLFPVVFVMLQRKLCRYLIPN